MSMQTAAYIIQDPTIEFAVGFNQNRAVIKCNQAETCFCSCNSETELQSRCHCAIKLSSLLFEQEVG